MAASPTAVPSPKTDGGNALAALLAAAAASMHRQQQQPQQQTHASVDAGVHSLITNNCSNGSTNTSTRTSTTKGNSVERQQAATFGIEQKGNSRNQTIQQQQLEAKRDTLCQLLNLKPASLIDTSSSANHSLADIPPSNNPSSKKSTSSSPTSVQHLLSSKSKMESIQHNHNQHFLQANGIDKPDRLPIKHENGLGNAKQNGACKLQVGNSNSYNNNSCSKESTGSSQHKRHASIKAQDAPATTTSGTTTTKPRNRTNHKSSISSTSSISTDKDSTNAAKLLVSLINGTALEPATSIEVNNVELRNLESWHDEDEELMDESCYKELVDPSNSNGWSADDMFKYNEKMHKITSSYNESTLSNNYTTPLPQINSKTTMRLATQLAREIQDRVLAEGRITPESSDDDELFENERMQRLKLKQHKQQLVHSKSPQRQQQHLHRCSNNQSSLMNNILSSKATKSSSQYSTSTETPATASLSSSPALNDTCTIIKPVTSSSRNILRTCLT